ncbi:MAG: hypothetical protein NTV01_01300 [Bacteroidia bacterium]|nr:hypothetical protein [Bacteroidia bacterium]
MALIAGTFTNNYSGSMAEAIENAFKSEWPNIMGTPAPATDAQMKLLCIAIAQGVIRHLVNHPEAFDINVNISGTNYPATVSIIPDDTLYP